MSPEVDILETCCEFLHSRKQGPAEKAKVVAGLGEFNCFTKCCTVRIGGTQHNAPPQFLSDLHDELCSKSTERCMKDFSVTYEECKVGYRQLLSAAYILDANRMHERFYLDVLLGVSCFTFLSGCKENARACDSAGCV